jgi:acyl-coenzyme A thioesterase PaaI-like protein
MPSANTFRKRHMRMLMNVWPPFLGAGIRITRLQPDWRAIHVRVKLHRWNSNYVGTHYGGSLYSMADPFFMLMLIENLGPEYIVWDKSASIRFRKPGRGAVSAAFQISEQELDEIREALRSADRIDRAFTVQVKDDAGNVIAEIDKQIQIRRRVTTMGANG